MIHLNLFDLKGPTTSFIQAPQQDKEPNLFIDHFPKIEKHPASWVFPLAELLFLPVKTFGPLAPSKSYESWSLVAFYNQMGLRYAHYQQWQTALDFFEKSYQRAKAEKDKVGKAAARHNQASVYFLQANWTQANRYYRMSLECHDTLFFPHEDMMIVTLKMMGKTASNNGHSFEKSAYDKAYMMILQRQLRLLEEKIERRRTKKSPLNPLAKNDGKDVLEKIFYEVNNGLWKKLEQFKNDEVVMDAYGKGNGDSTLKALAIARIELGVSGNKRKIAEAYLRLGNYLFGRTLNGQDLDYLSARHFKAALEMGDLVALGVNPRELKEAKPKIRELRKTWLKR